jgi:hypothetical protein
VLLPFDLSGGIPPALTKLAGIFVRFRALRFGSLFKGDKNEYDGKWRMNAVLLHPLKRAPEPGA